MSDNWPCVRVSGWTNYVVTKDGEVFNASRSTWRKLQPRPSTKYGHLKVTLWQAGARQHVWVHRLVLEAYRGEPKSGQVARHLNGDPGDNRLENLEWGTQKENGKDMVEHGRSTRGERNTQHKLTLEQAWEIKQAKGKERNRDVAARYGVHPNTVSGIWHERIWVWV